MSIPALPRASASRTFFQNPAVRAAAALIAVFASSAVHAEELRPMQAKSLHLGDVNGIAYYTVHPEGFRLVTTFAGYDGKPVRFETVLLPGQKGVVSTSGASRVDAQTVAFSRQGDRVLVETAPVQTQ